MIVRSIALPFAAYCCFLLIPSWTTAKPHNRTKRFLIFPPSSPQRHQFIWGVGVPLDTEISCVYGIVIKAQYLLPVSIADLQPDFFEGALDGRSRIRRALAFDPATNSTFERYNVEAEEVESVHDSSPEEDDEAPPDIPPYEFAPEAANNLEKPAAFPSRWLMYAALEQLNKQYGLGGRECMLRLLCDAAQAPFSYKSGILGEILHVLFTPSTTNEAPDEHKDNEYYRAEQLGREGANCEMVFKDCKQSLLDIFTGVYDPEILDFFGDFLKV